MDVAVVGDKYLINLFRLAGIEAVEVENEVSAASKVEQLAEDGVYKVLFISERVAARLRVLREKLVTEHRLYPVLVVIPNFDGSFGDWKSQLAEVVSRSVGAKLKVGE